MNIKYFPIIMSGCLLWMMTACTSLPKSGVLFDGKDTNSWETVGDVSIEEGILTLRGNQAQAVLKNGRYRDFDLSIEMRTLSGGKGWVKFHTLSDASKGYAVAIHNDCNDNVWWRMTGSLMSVRNLTKSFVKDDEWFKMNIRVQGRSVQVRINEVPVVEYVEPAKPYRVAPNEEALLSEGTFAIVGNGSGEIQIRHIAVEVTETDPRTLEALASAALDEQNDEIIRLHQEDFPVLDYHVHLKGGLTKEAAAAQSRRLGINYAIAPNCGIGFPVSTNEQIFAYIDTMRTQPFILAMQAEGREWQTTFSQEARDRFDYIFTDAMTFTDDQGHRTRSWIKEEVFIDNEEKYMDMMLDRMCAVLEEPVDVYVNPCYLPDQMSDRYDMFWTEERMNRFVEALTKSGKALEINELYRIPNKAILMKAKAKGVKFTFGSNNATPDVSKLSYSLQMKKELQLKAEDMYKPRMKQ